MDRIRDKVAIWQDGRRRSSQPTPNAREPPPDDSGPSNTSHGPDSNNNETADGRRAVSSAAAPGIQGNRPRSASFAGPIPRKPVPEPRPNDIGRSGISQSPEFNDRGAGRGRRSVSSAAAAGVQRNRPTSSPLAAPIPRKEVPISDLISPLDLEAGEVSSVSPPPRLETRRASHRGYGELHSATVPVTEMTAVLEGPDSNRSQSSVSEHEGEPQSSLRDSSGNDTPSGARGSLPPPPQTPDLPTQSTSDPNLHKRLPPLPASTPENLIPVPAIPHNFSYQSPVHTQPGGQASVSDLISLSSRKANPAENDIALEVTSPAVEEQAISVGTSMSGQAPAITTPKRSKYDYDGGSPSPSPAPKPQRSRFMSDPKQIADQIMAANHSNTPSGATTPQISSALGSRNPSGNSKQPGLWVPPSITARNIQTALAESPEPPDDDDRTPRALQSSWPIFPDPDSPTLKAYKTEPPRTGPGFNGRMGPMPPAGVAERSQLWETPHRLSDDEMNEIVDQYNALFGLTEGTRDSFMPRTHRYPEHGRDDEARLRKLDFERKTGETMSDEEYYSLFDHTTSTDGMLSTLLEWMQGREYVKAPYVNRIIHQLGRMMFTSAQEETRLRQRRHLECDFLRRALEDCEKRWRSRREVSDQEKTRSAELQKIDSSWNRVNDLSGREEEHIRENMDKWADKEGTADKIEKSFQQWKVLHDNLKNLLHERAQLESLITGGPCVLSEDIGRLRDIDVGIQQHREDFQAWRLDRTENLIKWLRVEGDDRSGGAKERLNIIHDELIREETILCGALDGLKQVADLERSTRELEATSLIDFDEKLPQPTLPDVSRGSDDNSLYAHPDSSHDSSNDSRAKELNASSENTQILVPSENPNVTVDILTPRGVRDRFDYASVSNDCAGCRERDELLREKDRTIQDQRHRLKDGYGKWAATQETATKLYQALKSARNKDIETALGHIERYREFIFGGWHSEMVHLENMFKTQVSRVDEEAALFKVPLEFLMRGGSPEVMAKDLEALRSSVRRLADSSLYVQQEFSRHLREMVARHDENFHAVTQQNVYDEQSKDALIRELRKQVADLTKRSRGTRENDAQRSLRVSEVLEKHMKSEIDKVREKIKRYRKEIGKQQKQCEADQTSTTSNDPEVAAKLKRDEERLKTLERQCSKAEKMIEGLKSELEKTKGAARAGEQIASDLNAEVASLQTQLEERDESGRWNLWDGTAVIVTDSSNPDIQRRNRVAQLQKDLLEAVVKLENETANQTITKARVSSATKLKNLVVAKTRRGGRKDSTETTQKEIEYFWRLVTFQRRRAEVISHLRRNQFEHAKDLLGQLLKDHGNWPTEYHGVEVRRSLHYLLAYAHARLAPIHRQSGVGVEITSKTLEDAKAYFAAAEKENEDAEHGQAWMALRVYLASEVKRTVDQLQSEKCGCKHKTRVCKTHEDNGVGVSYHNFMTIEGEEDVELELPQSALNSLDQYSRGPS